MPAHQAYHGLPHSYSTARALGDQQKQLEQEFRMPKLNTIVLIEDILHIRVPYGRRKTTLLLKRTNCFTPVQCARHMQRRTGEHKPAEKTGVFVAARTAELLCTYTAGINGNENSPVLQQSILS